MSRFLTIFLTCILGLSTIACAGNSFNEPSPQEEAQRYLGAVMPSYVRSGCLLTVPASSLTLGTFACTGFVRDTNSPPKLVPIVQGSHTVGPLNGGNGTYWLVLHRDTSSTVSGWTRQSGTHYLWKLSSSQPADPSAAMLFAKVTVAGGVITAVADFRKPSSYARRGVYDITDNLYGAVGDDSTDNTTILNNLFTMVNAQGGGIVYIPAGIFKTTAPLIILANTTLQGDGQFVSQIHAAHTGDGIQSTAAINTTTRKNVILKDFVLYSDSGSTGGGFVEVAGAFIQIRNVLIQAFKQQIIFDGTEHAVVDGCEFLTKTGIGIWFVEGADHTPSQGNGFTNVLTVTNSQFNTLPGFTTVTHIQIDGGASINLMSNNFNGGDWGIRAANTSNLVVQGNFFESQATHPIELASLTVLGNNFVRPNHTPMVRANSFSRTTTAALYHIRVRNALGGSLADNVFVGRSENLAMIILSGDPINDMLIAGNTKSLPSSIDKPFVSTTLAHLSAQRYQQRLFTTSATPANSGAGVVLTPRDMGAANTPERVRVSERILLMNPDQTVSEIATVTAVTATTLTATLVNSYVTDFFIGGLGGTSTLEAPGATTGVVAGTSTIASGSTSVVITHNLPYTPAAGDITITQTATTTNDTGTVWLSAIGTTTFTVNVRADPGASGFAFAWRIHPNAYRF